RARGPAGPGPARAATARGSDGAVPCPVPGAPGADLVAAEHRPARARAARERTARERPRVRACAARPPASAPGPALVAAPARPDRPTPADPPPGDLSPDL